MNILAVDTSTKFLSIGVIVDGEIVFAKDILAHYKTSSLIIPTIDKILRKLKIKLDDFDCFCVGLGPGSFTGIRIGAATIKAFSFCTNKRIIGIPSLDIVALNVKLDSDICVVSDARRKLLYTGFYTIKNGKILRKGSIQLLNIDSVLAGVKGRTVFLGDGAAIYRNIIETKLADVKILGEEYWYPKAHNLCLLAKEKFEQNKFISIDNLKPLYIYPKDCQVKR